MSITNILAEHFGYDTVSIPITDETRRALDYIKRETRGMDNDADDEDALRYALFYAVASHRRQTEELE